MKGIYKFTNNFNNKSYIGQSINLEKRYNDHRTRPFTKSSSMYNTAFYRAIRKYGFENFSYEILAQSNDYTIDKLNELEQYYISLYDTYYNGYNMNDGGNNVYTNRVITPKQVLEIKDLIVNTNITFRNIAKQYNISESLISQINKGIIWNYIGNINYPLRKDSYHNKGENNPSSKLTDIDIIKMRKRFVNESLDSIYQDYKDIISFSACKKIIYGVSFQHLPIYKKRQKQ